MKICVNDIVIMKKPHPCGSSGFRVLRTGLDYRFECQGCGRQLMIARVKAEKMVKTVIHEHDLEGMV